ncbi:MAG: putative aminopeptidase NPEPL1, partial [Myxococcota bacterium]
MTVELRYTNDLPSLGEDGSGIGYDAMVVCGTKKRLVEDSVSALLPAAGQAVWAAMVGSLSPGDFAAVTTTWLPGETPLKLTALAQSALASRHNAPGRPDVLKNGLMGRAVKGKTLVVITVADIAHADAAGAAAARSFPMFSLKSGQSKASRSVDVVLVGPDGPCGDLVRLTAIARGIRLAASLVDKPTSILNTTAFIAEAQAVAKAVGAECEVIDFEQLKERGFGGLVGVGKASVHKPALVHLKHRPANPDMQLTWVGKGIVYDTGGLSIKPKNGMPGMKGDMGGAAAVLGAFQAACETNHPSQIDALLCLAENSVGPEATRPDDVLTMYSGKTVEINNTDAEGRLVLADGVAYASKHLDPDVIVDLATLTGAQLVATGKRHAAIVCNDDALEAAAIAAGKQSGDLVHPLPFAPE